MKHVTAQMLVGVTFWYATIFNCTKWIPRNEEPVRVQKWDKRFECHIREEEYHEGEKVTLGPVQRKWDI